jgi:hypothetical protein
MKNLFLATLCAAISSQAFAEHLNYPAERESAQQEFAPAVASQWQGPVFGILVTGVNPHSPAEHLGIAVGDVLYQMDGAPIRSALTWANVRNGKECDIAVYRPSTRTTTHYQTGKGLIGIAMRDEWYSHVPYVKASGMKLPTDQDVVTAAWGLQHDRLHVVDEALDRLPKHSRRFSPVPELQQSLAWNENSQSISRVTPTNALQRFDQSALTPFVRHLGRRLLANAFYGEFISLAHAHPDIVAGDTEFSLDELQKLQPSEDNVLSQDVDDIRTLGWRRLKLFSLQNDNAPMQWLPNILLRQPYEFSIPSAHYEVVVPTRAAHDTWIHLVLRFDDTDDHETRFANAVKIGFVASKDQPDGGKSRIYATMQTDGIVALTAYGKKLTYFYAGYKANEKNWITVDLIAYQNQWFYLINNKEMARGPILHPVEQKCVYIPYIHFCGIQGEVRTLEIRTLHGSLPPIAPQLTASAK